MSDIALKRCFPVRGEAVIDPEIGSEQSAFGSHAKVLDRAELNFHFARFRDGRIGAVEWLVGLCRAVPTNNHRRSCERRYGLDRLHGVGSNTQIAAGSTDLARTATKSRSSSGTNSEVRAPGTVGTRESRR